MNILLTGSTGFLGRSLLKCFVNRGDHVVSLLRKTSNIKRIGEYINKTDIVFVEDTDLEKLFINKKFDIVVHCATDYGRTHKNTWEILEPNLLLPVKLLELARRNSVKAFFNTDTVLDKGISDYALSKSQFFDWLKRYSKQIVTVNLSLEHFYGPDDDPTKFVTMSIQKMLSNHSHFPLTKGLQKRDFIFIDDVCDASILLIDKSMQLRNGLYEHQIGTGDLVTIKEFVNLIKSLTGSKINLGFGELPYRENEHMSVPMRNNTLGDFNWRPKIGLIEGLKRTIEFERKK